jgi:hypothetical protein
MSGNEIKKELLSSTADAPSTPKSDVPSIPEGDGLDSFSLDQFGMRGGTFGGSRIIKYVTDHYVTTQGEVISPTREFVALGLKKLVQKFIGNKQAAPPIIVPDGQLMPDIDAMNEAAPRSEWGQGLDGKPKGPFVGVLALQLLDPNNMDRYIFVTQTKGGAIAIGDLADKTKMMRRFSGADTKPIVTLGIAPFRIAWLNVVKKRPDLKVVRWIKFGGGGGGDKLPVDPSPLTSPSMVSAQPTAAPISTVVSPPTTPVQPLVTPAPATVTTPAAFGTPVKEPTMREEVGDTIPF